VSHIQPKDMYVKGKCVVIVEEHWERQRDGGYRCTPFHSNSFH